VACRFCGGFQPGRQGYQLGYQVRAVGSTKERPPRPSVAGSAREETTQSHTSCTVQTVLDYGDQPKGKLERES